MYYNQYNAYNNCGNKKYNQNINYRKDCGKEQLVMNMNDIVRCNKNFRIALWAGDNLLLNF